MADIPFKKNARFVCVDYPGIVLNEDKMLETLGGESDISKTFSEPARRLELRWRPKDLYCKPACADRFTTTNLLMKVKRKQRKKKSDDSQTGSSDHSKPDEKYESEFIGLIDTTYKFQGLADFQYLPMQKKEDGYQSLYDKLVITKMKDMNWLKEEVPLFLPPPIFSRIDSLCDYNYKGQTQHRDGYVDPNKMRPANLIGVARQRRPHFTIFCKFEDPDIPVGPIPEAISKFRPRIKDDEKEQELAELFETRPIWSKNAIKCNMDIHPEKLKLMLPLIAYFFTTGPWRTLWVKFGYDPRKDVKAKIYQLVDYRVKRGGGPDNIKINPKRSTFNYSLPNTVTKLSGQIAVIQQEDLRVDDSDDDKNENEAKEITYKFRPGVLPPFRQMFYQLCDLDEPKIQELLKQNDGKESVCTERDGWCIENIQDKCRQILASHISPLINRDPRISSKGKASAKHPAKSSSKKKKTTVTNSDSGSDADIAPSDSELNEMETEILDMV